MFFRIFTLASVCACLAPAADSVFVPGAFNGIWAGSNGTRATFTQSADATVIPLMNAIGGAQWAESNCPPATERREFYSGTGPDGNLYACTNGSSFLGVFTDKIDGRPGTGSFSASVTSVRADTLSPFPNFTVSITSTLQGSGTVTLYYQAGGISTPLAWLSEVVTIDSSTPRNGAYISASDPFPPQVLGQVTCKLNLNPQGSLVVIFSDKKGVLATTAPVSLSRSEPSRQIPFSFATSSFGRALESPITLRAELRGPANELLAASDPVTFTLYTPPGSEVSVYPSPWTFTATDDGFGSNGVLANFYVYCPPGVVDRITATRLLNGPGNDWLENVRFYKDGSLTPGGVGFRLNTPTMAYGVNWNAVRLQWPGGQLDVPIVVTRLKSSLDKQMYVYPQSLSFEPGLLSGGGGRTTVTVDGAWGAPPPSNWKAQAADPNLILVSDLRPSTFSARVNESLIGKSSGSRVSTLTVTAPNYRQQMLPVSVRFLGANDPLAPILSTGALLFRPGDPSRPQFASRQTLTVSCQSSSDVSLYASAVTVNGYPWIRLEPPGLDAGGSIPCSVSQPASVTVTADPSVIPAFLTSYSAFNGVVNFRINSEVRPLRVTIIPRGSPTTSPLRLAASCTPTKVFITETQLPDSFSISANAPRALTAEVSDDCGAWLTDATVTASFSNGDRPIQLHSFGNGSYSAVWTPSVPLLKTRVTLQASSGALTPAAQTIDGEILPDDSSLPVLEPNGVLNNLNPKLGAALSPGMVAQIYGRNMGKTTELMIGGKPAYLFYVSDTQLVAHIPAELAPDQSYPVVLTANGMVTTLPEIYLAPAQPGVAAFPDGRLIAQHADYKLVDAANPAKPGEALILYLVGMGATTPAVPSGAPSPSNPPATTQIPPRSPSTASPRRSSSAA